MSTRERACENLARTLWTASRFFQPCDDITGLCHIIANDTGCDWNDLRADVLYGLEQASEAYHQGDSAELACCGYCRFGDEDCYWWHNGAETCWSSDKPDWWDAQVEQWSGSKAG
jgi:hypothetical protein